MNKKKLYIGTIKKCLDSYSLEIFGEENCKALINVKKKKINNFGII